MISRFCVCYLHELRSVIAINDSVGRISWHLFLSYEYVDAQFYFSILCSGVHYTSTTKYFLLGMNDCTQHVLHEYISPCLSCYVCCVSLR
jgi:hypothetical protein